MSHLISPNKQIGGLVSHINTIVDEKPADVTIMRQPASGYLVLNSRDRYVNASPSQTEATYQPWNDFVLQKAQSIIPTFAKRIGVSEVRFPWLIPNINARNSRFLIQLNLGGAPTLDIRLDEGFYTPGQLVTALNDAIAAQGIILGIAAGDLPVVVYSAGRFIISAGVNGTTFALYAVSRPAGPLGNPYASVITNSLAYNNAANLLLTLGIPFEYLSTVQAAPVLRAVVGGDYSLGLYTEYVDIISEKLMRFTDARDGGSGDKTKTSVVCRLYLADEVSLPKTDASGSPVFPGQIPVVIHRQFASPKMVQWSPQSFVGDLDLQVYDMFGELVYQPTSAINPSRLVPYPDYQITMLASEN